MKSGPRPRHTVISAPATTPPWPRGSSSVSARKSTGEWTPGCTARRPIRRPANLRRRGPGYDEAVAEGLVERIGAEIDKRIDARLAQTGAAESPGPAPGPAGTDGPAGYPPYQGYQGYLGPVLPPGYQLGPPPVRPAPV